MSLDPKKNRDIEIEKILEKFTPHIKKALQNTSYQEREDLEQEIKLKILEKINSVEFNNPPNFWEFIEEKKRSLKKKYIE